MTIVDLSKWNGPIVRPPEADVVLHRATEGVTETDRHYLTSRAVVDRSPGVVWGAYHLWSWETEPGDQAHHYLDVAQLSPGDVRPILDLETKEIEDELEERTVTELLQRLQAWIDHMPARPILYCSARGWRRIEFAISLLLDSQADDAQRRARALAGAVDLWVADKRVKSVRQDRPRMPQMDQQALWDRWLMWQYRTSDPDTDAGRALSGTDDETVSLSYLRPGATVGDLGWGLGVGGWGWTEKAPDRLQELEQRVAELERRMGVLTEDCP